MEDKDEEEAEDEEEEEEEEEEEWADEENDEEAHTSCLSSTHKLESCMLVLLVSSGAGPKPPWQQCR